MQIHMCITSPRKTLFIRRPAGYEPTTRKERERERGKGKQVPSDDARSESEKEKESPFSSIMA